MSELQKAALQAVVEMENMIRHFSVQRLGEYSFKDADVRCNAYAAMEKLQAALNTNQKAECDEQLMTLALEALKNSSEIVCKDPSQGHLRDEAIVALSERLGFPVPASDYNEEFDGYSEEEK